MTLQNCHVLVIKKDTEIQTDINNKPNDTTNYLLFSSFHPKRIKMSIPFSLARRISILTDENNLRTRTDELRKALFKQSNPKTL